MNWSDASIGRRIAIGGVLLAIALVLVFLLAAPAGPGEGAGAKVDSSAAVAPDAPDAPGELVGAPNAPSTPPAATDAPARAVAPIAAREEETDAELPPYSSASVEVGGAPKRDAGGAQQAATALERATRGVHECEQKAQARHERLGRPGRIDPLLCVYDHTAMHDEKGAVRMDIVTPTGYSYYVDAGGTRYRYSEYDGEACHSIDGVVGCSAW